MGGDCRKSNKMLEQDGEQVTARPIIFSAPMIRALTFEMIYKNVDKVTA